jgi:xylose dehydrogenase (NAD/NADP)
VTLRWGFLGASRIGRRALAPAVLAASGHALHAVGARDPGRAREFATEFSIAKAYGSYREVVEDPDVDVIYNALPNDAHAPWTIAALEAGKHVLCEKPLTLSAVQVRQVQDAERRTGRRVMEAFCHVFHPQVARVRELLDAGAIGPLVAIEACYGHTLDNADDYRWIGRHGGGSLFDIGCYCVSAMRVLSGREPVRASAVQAMRGEVDASFSGLLDFGDGIGGQLFCSYVSARTQHLTLIGKVGTIRLEWPFATKGRSVRLICGDNVEEFSPIDPYVVMVEQFGLALLGRAEMKFGLAWSLRQAQALDALFAAARSGTTVSVSP